MFYSQLWLSSLPQRSPLGIEHRLLITVVDQQQAAIRNARVAVYPQGASTAIRGTTNERGSCAPGCPRQETFLVEVDAEVSDFFHKRSAASRKLDHIIALELAGIDSSIVVTAADMPQTIDQISKAITVVGPTAKSRIVASTRSPVC